MQLLMHPRRGRVTAPLIHAFRARTPRFSGSQVPGEAPCLHRGRLPGHRRLRGTGGSGAGHRGLRGHRWRKLWMARWKSACSGGQHGHRCGYLVDSERILKLVPADPCAAGVAGSRNTSLPETGTKPGATPERRKNRETGTSRGYPVPAAGRLTKSPPGNQRASGQRPGQAPASHTCRGLAYSQALPIPAPHPFTGLYPFPRGLTHSLGLAHSPRPGPVPGPPSDPATAVSAVRSSCDPLDSERAFGHDQARATHPNLPSGHRDLNPARPPQRVTLLDDDRGVLGYPARSHQQRH